MLQRTSRASSPPDRGPVLCFMDTETTGLDPERHGVWQIGGCIQDPRREEDDWFEFTIRPFPGDVIDQEAMDKMGVDVEAFETYDPPEVVFQQLTNTFASHVDRYNPLDKMVFLGYNAPFDERFVREFWRKAHIREGKYFGSWFFMPVIDVAGLAHLVLMQDRLTRNGPEKFNLSSVANHLGVEVDSESLHDAVYDVELTLAIYEKCMERLHS